MTTRRSNGEGSVFYRSNRDKWVAALFDPLTGKTMTRSARTKADANRLLWEMRNRIDDGAPAADSPLTLVRYLAGNPRGETTQPRHGEPIREPDAAVHPAVPGS